MPVKRRGNYSYAYRKRSRSGAFHNERYRVLDSHSVGTGAQGNSEIWACLDVSTAAAASATVPVKISNMKIQLIPPTETANGYLIWMVVYVPRGSAVPTINTSGEITTGNRSYVMESGILGINGANVINTTQYTIWVKQSRRMKGGDAIYFCYYNNTNGTCVFSTETDFTITT